jgi:TolB-like protein/Tfp pilus assembly protein PilF
MPGRRATWLAAALALASLAVMALLLLREPTPVAASDPISGSPPRLVVLPFANLTGDAADDYIVDGLTDELITRLGQIAPDRLAVVARTSAMRYRGGADLARVALELDVDYALEGSVRREGDRIRVSARLVRVADGAQQWTGVFGRERHRALDVQADVARLVAAALPLHLPASPRAWLTRDGTSHPAAREAYLRGKWFANQTTPEGMRRSIEQLNRAIVIDPQYARAHAALAASLHFGGAVGVIDQAEARRLTHEAAGRALELDPTAGDALVVLAESRFRFGGETKGVEQMFRRAAALRPQDPDVLHWLGMFLALTGDAGEALATLERARQIDPLALHLGADYAAVLYLAGRREEAARELERVRELDPLFPKTYLVEASIALDEESHTDAIAALRRANELSPGTPKYVASLARAYAAAGRTNDARRTLAELRTLAGSVHVAPELIRVVERELVAAP